MAIELDSRAFQGNPLLLIGQIEFQIITNHPGARITAEGPGATRLSWVDGATDEDDGSWFPIKHIVRLNNGTAWAGGIWAADHLFIYDRTIESGIIAVGKPIEYHKGMTNWIAMRTEEYYDFGVSF